ncbi:MAG: hypothetical protein QOK40_2913 [Miltoncostaeaceae bacterium]|jgi:hypothetical protein|nr:hypothetical protein [Miltoncostaeaceae bacterium]
MSEPAASDQRFVERVMTEVARQERRLPRVLLALAVSALVLAVPAVLALRARVALDAALALSLASARELVLGIGGSPFFWVGAGLAALWLGWLSWRALGGRR